MRSINRKWNSSILIVVLIVSLSMSFFYVLYRYNNKYISQKENAIQGILRIEDFSENDSLYYLAREWEYYPGVLLTPQELKENRSAYSSQYVSIGEMNVMEPGREDGSPYGSGTYRLRILLPDKKETYALLFNEVFSAYSLYINGELIAQIGNPDPENYQEQIQNRMFTFEASKMVDVMIAVTDERSASPGIQYLPVFGVPFQVNIQRGFNGVIYGLLMMLSLIIMLFSLYYYTRTRVKKVGLFSLICFCIFGYTSYGLIHMFFALKVQPWYALELLLYFMMFPLMILMMDSILEEKNKITLIFAIFTGGCAVACFFGELLLSRFDSIKMIQVFSIITETMKWITACYLIGICIYTMKKKKCSLILAAAVFYGCSLASDRIWTLYEPIVGGWFPELGGGVLACAFGISIWKSLADAYRMQLVYEEKNRQLEKTLMLEKEHFEEMNRKAEEMNRIRHDIRQHLRLLDSLLKQKKYEELETYLGQFTQEYQKKDVSLFYCKNVAVDAIIHYYAGQFQNQEIEFQCRLEIPEQTEISDIDFCRMFGNLLENAMEAVVQLPQAQARWVSCMARIRNHKLLIEIKNTCQQSWIQKKTQILSTKHAGNGIGILSVKGIAEKYGGYADFQMEKGVFRANVFFTLDKNRIQASDSEAKRY